jgi:hypothetical protein
MLETETVNEGADTARDALLDRAICVCGTRMRHDIPDIWFRTCMNNVARRRLYCEPEPRSSA